MKKYWSKTWVKWLFFTTVCMVVIALSMTSILRGIGKWLSKTDPPELTSMCFVLGGNSYERGSAAVELFHQFPEQRFIATGGNYPYQILCLDTSMLECELTKHYMLNRGIPQQQVDTLSSAHSTMDESNEIMRWCKKNQVNHITLISSAFHMRRVRMVFEEKFEDEGIRINFHGARPIDYSELNWWNEEEGLIMTNNELVKIFYYAIKY